MKAILLLMSILITLYAHCEVTSTEKYDYKEQGSRPIHEISRIVRQRKATLFYLHNRRLKENLYLPNSNVKVWISIDDSGKVFDCHIAHSRLRDSIFEQGIVRKVMSWNFGPAPVKDDTTSTMLHFTFLNDRFGQSKSIAEILLQRLLDHPRLNHFFHTELPNRNPLYIQGDEMLLHHYELTVGGNKVVFLPEKRKKNTLHVKRLEFTHCDHCIIELFYPIEGVKVNAEFKNREAKWELVEISLVER